MAIPEIVITSPDSVQTLSPTLWPCLGADANKKKYGAQSLRKLLPNHCFADDKENIAPQSKHDFPVSKSSHAPGRRPRYSTNALAPISPSCTPRRQQRKAAKVSTAMKRMEYDGTMKYIPNQFAFRLRKPRQSPRKLRKK